MPSFLNATYRNIRSGLALAAFRKTSSASDFVINTDQLLILIALALLLKILVDFGASPSYATFTVYAVPVWGFNQFALIALVYLGARLFKVSHQFLNILLINSSMVVLALFFSLYEFWIKQQPNDENWVLILSITVSIYGLAACFWQYYQSSQLKRFASFMMIGLIALSTFDQYYLKDYQQFWYSDDEEYAETQPEDFWSEYRKIDAESLIYRQPELLNTALSHLKPQQKNRSELFFVGFAGYALQDVFMKEISFARHTVDQQLATQGHSINLINHLDTIDTQPLATATNLASTLRRIGQIMDKDNDILMLYMTSHGSDDHHVSVSFWPLPFNDITPERLKAMLDNAGIKWRIIIISACYSGGYVPTLASPNTLIATAAAADKTSFGCSNEAEFTYYGQALFKEQLAQHVSLLTALPNAITSIEAREKSEGLEPSHPQLVIGKAIQQKLSQWEASH